MTQIRILGHSAYRFIEGLVDGSIHNAWHSADICTRVYQQLDETDNEFGFITIEFYKNSRLIYDQPIEKSPDNAIYFMNDNGVTVDKLAWPSKPK